MLKHPLAFAITAAGLVLSLSAGVQAAENGKFRIGIVTFLSGPAAGPFGEPSANAAKVLVKRGVALILGDGVAKKRVKRARVRKQKVGAECSKPAGAT